MDYLDGLTSIVALSWLALLCCVGVFHEAFEDNLAQRIGMAGLAMWAIARVWEKLHTWDSSALGIMMHCCLALYATGTAWKVYRRYLVKKRAVHLMEMDSGQLRHVAGDKR